MSASRSRQARQPRFHAPLTPFKGRNGMRDYIFSFLKSSWYHFAFWRRSRPFWAGLLTMLGGAPIVYIPYAEFTLDGLAIRMSTTAGSSSLVIGTLLVTLGLLMWFQKSVRIFTGVAAILLGLVSISLSNLGGFLVGLLLALLGGALSIAWTPGEPT